MHLAINDDVFFLWLLFLTFKFPYKSHYGPPLSF